VTQSSAPSVSAQLSVRRGRAAVEFYRAEFGAEEVYRVGGTDAHEAVVSELRVGDTTFWVADESPEHANFSPESLGGRRRDRRLARRRGTRLASGTDRRPVRPPLGGGCAARGVAAR
jgi:catechol 2,3-dioxygenase-like lactoylglutathione lyase family enzyme